MFLNKNQERLLIEISKQKGNKSILVIGKKVYNTYISVYNNMALLKLYGYVDLNKKKNKIIATLTPKGIICVNLIAKKIKIIDTQ